MGVVKDTQKAVAGGTAYQGQPVVADGTTAHTQPAVVGGAHHPHTATAHHPHTATAQHPHTANHEDDKDMKDKAADKMVQAGVKLEQKRGAMGGKLDGVINKTEQGLAKAHDKLVTKK